MVLDRDVNLLHPSRERGGQDTDVSPSDPPPRVSAPLRERSSTVLADRDELETFKRVIDLSEYAAARGYQLDRKESSRSSRVMRCDGDKISISRAPDGHWVYYSFRNLEDNGTIVDFVANRDCPHAMRGQVPLGLVRQELRRWTHTERHIPEFARVDLKPTTKDLAQVEQTLARAQLRISHPYLESRALSPSTLSDPRFRGTWSIATGYFRDGLWQPLCGDRGNVLFPHRDENGVCGYEAKNRDFTGFAPGGEKGLWASRVRATDNVLVIAESAIDAISYHELSPNPKARYVSFAGQMNPRQPALLERAVTWMPAGASVIAATDRDHAGHAYARQIEEICERHPSVSFVRHEPRAARGKDWNDQLREHRARSRTLSSCASAKELDR